MNIHAGLSEINDSGKRFYEKKVDTIPDLDQYNLVEYIPI